MSDIVYQNKDVAAKVTGEALVGRSLAPFNLPQLKIVDILPTNLPAIESNELRLDNLFLLSDGSIAIIDYESDFKRENFVKYLNYIARVVKRYSIQKRLGELHEIRVIVIYTADVEHAEEVFDLGSLTLTVESAYLVNMNSNHIYQKLRFKIENGESLSEEEMTELMILPLTAKGKEAKKEYIEKAIQMAKQLPNRTDALTVLSGILTFTDKIIDKEYAQILKEEYFVLTQVEQLLYEDCMERAKKNARKEVWNEVKEEVRDEVIAEVRNELTASVTKEVTESVTKKVTESVTKKVTESVTKKVTESVTKKVTESVTKKVTESVTKSTIMNLAQTYRSLELPKEQFVQVLMSGFQFTEKESSELAQAFWA